MDKVETWKNITRTDLELYLFHSYISMESWTKWDWLLKVADHVGLIKLKLTSIEYATLKSEAQIKAKNIWKSTTGALA